MPDSKRELMTYRLEMAEERLHSAKILLDDKSYKVAEFLIAIRQFIVNNY